MKTYDFKEIIVLQMQPVFKLQEQVDVRRVDYLLSYEGDLFDKPNRVFNTRDILKKYKDGYKRNGNKFICEYKECAKYNFGRLYPHAPSKSGRRFACGAALMNKTVRSYLLSEHYLDVDMSKAHYSILYHLFTKYELPSGIDILDEVFLDPPIRESIAEKCGCSLLEAKQWMSALLNTSPTVLSEVHCRQLVETFPCFKDIHELVYKHLVPRLQVEYPDIFTAAKKASKWKANTLGCFMSHMLQHYERLMMTDIIEFLQKERFEVGAIIHDGFLLHKEHEEHIPKIKKDVYSLLCEKYEGMRCMLEVKAWFPIPEDWVLHFHEPEIPMTEYRILSDRLCDYITQQEIVFTETEVYKKSDIHPNIYTFYKDSYKAFLREVFAKDDLYKNSPRAYDDMIKVLQNIRREEVQLLKPDRRFLALKNGLLDLEHNHFIALDGINGSAFENVIARHYIPYDYDPSCMDTPILDRVLEKQLIPEAIHWLKVLSIRLLYPPSRDSLQVAPYICGLCDTFKSQYAEIISQLFKKDRVGSLNRSNEATFGMEALLDKEAIISTDCPQDLAKTLENGLFKQMISGENVSVPMKFKKAKTVIWQVPYFFVSNYLPNWENYNGAIGKRLALFRFTQPVEKTDSTLSHQIITQELTKLLAYGMHHYHELLKTNVSTFTGIRPEYFNETCREYTESVNLLFSFLRQSDYVDKQGNRHIIRIEPNNEEIYTTRDEMSRRFSNYCKHRDIKEHKNMFDESVFYQLGIRTQKDVQICKGCNRKAVRVQGQKCCNKYSAQNRTRRNIYVGVAFETQRERLLENRMTYTSEPLGAWT